MSRNAVVALGKAVTHGFTNVEVRINAPGMTRAQVAAEFANPTTPGQFSSPAVSRTIVDVSDGTFVAPRQGVPVVPVPPPPPRPDQQDERAPAPGRAVSTSRLRTCP